MKVCNNVNAPVVLGIVSPILLMKNDIYVLHPKLPIEDGKVQLNDKPNDKLDNPSDSTLPSVADPEIVSHVTPATNI